MPRNPIYPLNKNIATSEVQKGPPTLSNQSNCTNLCAKSVNSLFLPTKELYHEELL